MTNTRSGLIHPPEKKRDVLDQFFGSGYYYGIVLQVAQTFVVFLVLEKIKSIPTPPGMAALSARHVLRLLRQPYALQARQGR